ncbi:MAG: peptidase S41 [Flavobacteriales bacterium]|nr:peptidase S41 [Flavobacteriales bacterium]
MKKLIVIVCSLFLTIIVYSQKKNNPLNFDFEQEGDGTAVDWKNFGSEDYLYYLDTTISQKGKNSAVLEYHGNEPDFKAWAYTIPNNYDGKKITLTGYIKTKNVTDGYAGLWMRIDPQIAFDNMRKRGAKGTTDWTKYEVTLDMNPEKTDRIVVGGLLVGKGKMWLDNLKVTIDGKEISTLKPIAKKEYLADKDNQFDNGSEIESITIEGTTVEDLKKLGLIWGFLKYYHPNIAKGTYNWDYELFRILPNYLKAENNTKKDELIVKWINDLGSFSTGKESKKSNVKIEPDLDWIKTSGFSDNLTTLLLSVKTAKRTKGNYYISLEPGVGNPKFTNEKSFSTSTYPDAGIRLLALYRYWNMIQYYFPYKNLIEEDWKDVLTEFILKVNNTSNETEYTLAMLELIGRVHDTHATIRRDNKVINKYWGEEYAVLDLTFIENKPVVTGYYDDELGKKSGLIVGDEITSINNKSVEEIIKDRLVYTPASNYSTKLRNIAANLLRTNDSIIHIEYLHDGIKKTAVLNTYSSKNINLYSKYHYTDTCYRLINNDIAYINNGSVNQKYLPEIWKEIKNTKGLIIDIRNYPSDFVIYRLSNYLMPKKTPFVTFTTGSITTPGLFSFGEELNAGMKNKDYYKGKVILIVNETTQSSAEFHAMAYQVNPNTITIGSTTAGADGNVSMITLPGGIKTMISGIGVYYPDGRETQRVGIVPDIEVKPTIEGIRNGKDEVLEKAIEIINEK